MKKSIRLVALPVLALFSFFTLHDTRADASLMNNASPEHAPVEQISGTASSTGNPPATATPAPAPTNDNPAPAANSATNETPYTLVDTTPNVGVAEKVKPVEAASDPKASTVKKVGKITLPAEKVAPVSIARFAKPPVIDGQLDEEVWQQAALLKDFYQINPGDNSAPSKPTEVLIGYDAKTLYIAFRAYDEPDKVRATVARRDQIFNDDYVGFYLDTFNDRRRAYAIFFSPLGVQADGIQTEGRGEDYSLDIVMDSKGQVTSEGYIVEVAIPFKSLRYEAGRGKQWGAHFFRRIKRLNNELDSWMPFSRDVQGDLNQTGHLTGLEDISTERTLEIIPSLTLSETGKRLRSYNSVTGQTDPGRLVNEPAKFEPGLTAKFGLTPQITLDLAINPDFAQVEADQLVNTANQRFPIFFPERRPFFLEGRDIFETTMNVVHTRAIIDPDVAFKISGKRGKNSFGLMLASDHGPGNFIGDERLEASNQPFLDKNAHIGVLRLKRDIGQDHNLGLIATTYNFIQKHNHVLGFDGRFKLTPKVIVEFQALGTTTRGNFFAPDRDQCFNRSTLKTSPSTVLACSQYRTGNALGYNFFMNYSGRNLYTEFFATGRTRDYRTDVGFVPRNNTNQNGFFIGWYSTPKEKARLTSWNVRSFSYINYDFQGRIQAWENGYIYHLNFPRQTWLEAGYRRGYERLFEEEFGRTRRPGRAGRFFGDAERSAHKNNFFINGGSTISKRYSFNASAAYRTGQLDLDFGGGRKFPRISPLALANRANPACPAKDADAATSPPICFQLDPGRGQQWELNGAFNWQPTDAMRSTLNFTKVRLTRHDTGRVAFDDNLISTRTTYQFTRFLFARARFDYSTRTTNLKSQMLLGYTPNPGTAFYVGYDDDVFYRFNPISDLLDPGFTRRERRFFIKMSYLFRKSFG